jgi:hypothetical protein
MKNTKLKYDDIAIQCGLVNRQIDQVKIEEVESLVLECY